MFWCLTCCVRPRHSVQVCFSKLSTETLLLCDICEKEWHMECLNPALAEVRWLKSRKPSLLVS